MKLKKQLLHLHKASNIFSLQSMFRHCHNVTSVAKILHARSLVECSPYMSKLVKKYMNSYGVFICKTV